MQNYTPLLPTGLISADRAKINNNIDSVASNFSGNFFPTQNLQEGMRCWRTDKQQLFQYDATSNEWILVDDLSKGYNSVAHANRADYATKDADGNDIAETYSKQAETNKIILQCYPVGSIYMSVNSTSPATLFGGTWQQISGGRVLIGASASYKAGAMGGNESQNITLTTSNMPAHNHSVSATTASAGGHTHTRGTMNITGSFPQCDDLYENTSARGQVTGAFAWDGGRLERSAPGDFDEGSYRLSFNASRSWTGTTSSNGAHTHSVSVSVGNNGNGQAFNVSHMQPYLVVYIWQRVA